MEAIIHLREIGNTSLSGYVKEEKTRTQISNKTDSINLQSGRECAWHFVYI